jgi:spermidine synthase
MDPPGRLMAPLVWCAAFLSGCSALVFETLWFRQAGLLLGNSIWSSSLVLSAFMAGLAIGNGLGGRLCARLRRPLAVYAVLEVAVGVSGASLVAGMPHLTPLLLPALRAARDVPALLVLVRAAAAFLLLLVPATAMGLTLPVLVEALRRDDRRFAWTLGQVYGWNTTGAVVGTLLGELVLLSALGVRGSGLAAAGLDFSAAAIALSLVRGAPVRATAEGGEPRPSAPLLSGPLLAAFLAGFLLLALEVVWFRLLLLTAVGTSLSFAVMLAVVLAGIAGGGLIGGWLARTTARVAAAASVVGFLAGAATAITYALFPATVGRLGAAAVATVWGVAGLAAPLMLPTCLLSGLLFPVLGEAVRKGRSSEGSAAGLLTLANTLGAMLGALVGGFVLLPYLGMERSIYVLGLGYAGVGLLSLPAAVVPGRPRALLPAGAGALALAAMLAAFPFGLMGRSLLPRSLARWMDVHTPGLDVVAVREGLTETAVLLRRTQWGTPVSYRLITNAISMSALDSFGGRYMRAFVYLPVALHPRPRRALLVSYGLGSTARALVDTASLESIDVVDVSRNVIDATRAIYPEPGTHPLDDPRVRLHIEDGRFFLLTTADTFDIITAEPPPPNNAGIGSLYSREYFALLRSRLAAGGIASYWLPAYQLHERDSQAIVAAFCSAFPDCTLWSGSGAEWIMLGTRDAPPVDEEAFSRQWSDPRVRRWLSTFGFERPEDLGVTFLAGARDLAAWTRGVPALDDDHPYRISPEVMGIVLDPYWGMAKVEPARDRFARSRFVSRLWPPALRERTLAAFAVEAPLLRAAWAPYGIRPSGLLALHDVLVRTRARTGVLWMMGSDAFEERAAAAARARGVADPELFEVEGIAAMADRDYRSAEHLFARAQPHARSPGRLVAWRVLALCLADDHVAASALAASDEAVPARGEAGYAEMATACGVRS